MEQQPQTITRDLILDLRRRGLHLEATKLLKQFHEIGKKNMREGKKANYSIANNITGKKLYNRRKKEGLCVKCGGIKETDHVWCNACKLKMKKEYERKKNNDSISIN